MSASLVNKAFHSNRHTWAMMNDKLVMTVVVYSLQTDVTRGPCHIVKSRKINSARARYFYYYISHAWSCKVWGNWGSLVRCWSLRSCRWLYAQECWSMHAEHPRQARQHDMQECPSIQIENAAFLQSGRDCDHLLIKFYAIQANCMKRFEYHYITTLWNESYDSAGNIFL